MNKGEVIRGVFLDMAKRVKEVNVANGWHDTERSIGDGMALLHSEVAEAFDAWRKHGFTDAGTITHAGTCALFAPERKVCTCGAVWKPQSYGSELADVLIRLLDQADRDGVDLVAEFERKLAFNRTRGYKHGGRAV